MEAIQDQSRRRGYGLEHVVDLRQERPLPAEKIASKRAEVKPLQSFWRRLEFVVGMTRLSILGLLRVLPSTAGYVRGLRRPGTAAMVLGGLQVSFFVASILIVVHVGL